MNEAKCRRIVRERSGDSCEVRIDGPCLGRGANMHHRRNRSQGGPWTPSNILHLCGDGVRGCHGYITHNPAEAAAEGWTAKSWEQWTSKPVRLWHGYCLLDDQGDWTNLGSEPPILEHATGCPWWTTDVCGCGAIA